MISDQDIKKLEKTFVTKTEFKKLDKKVGQLDTKVGQLDKKVTELAVSLSGVQEEVGGIKLEIGEIKYRLDSFETNISNKLDTIFGAIQDIREDNAVGAAVMGRHTRQIEALAVHTGMVLSD